jgi:DNA-3-methyladenine glycosylase
MRSFYRRDAVTVARALLGQRLVHIIDGVRLSGVIVETEAYLGAEDRAAHTFGGRRTKRNEMMYADGGHAYVYFTYGMHHCLNVVTGTTETGTAVLLRAVEPVEGLEMMRARRAKAKRDTDLCSGPAKLTQAMGITLSDNGRDLVTDEAFFIQCVRSRALPAKCIAAGPRIGIGYAGEWACKPLRFWVRGHPHVSGATTITA